MNKIGKYKISKIILICVFFFALIFTIQFSLSSLTLGTNFGFVATAPTTDPAGSNIDQDTYTIALKDTAPTGAIKITEIGWWCDGATEESNFEVGVYSNDVANSRPGNLLAGASQTNAKGTTAGWKKATVNIDVTAGTIYWLAVQLDDTATTTNGNYGSVTGAMYHAKIGQTTLPSPWSYTNYVNGAYAYGIYAVYSTGAPSNSCTCPASNTNWAIAMGDYCNITANCNLGTGNLTFTGTGWMNTNSTINTKSGFNLANNQIIYLNGTEGIIYIG
jgi:hypothetical protein